MASRLWAIVCVLMAVGATSCDAAADQIDRGKEHRVADIVVNNATQLTQALSEARGGDVIILAAGDYGNVNIHNISFDQPVTIRSQNLSDLAHIDRIDVFQSRNIVLDDLNVGSPLAANEGITTWTSAIRVRSSSNVTLESVEVQGTDDNNPLNDRVGLYVTDSAGVTIANSEFSNLHQGAHFTRTTDIVIKDNVVHDIRLDGFNFAQVNRVLLDGNHFSNFWRQTGDHSDAIQFWTAQTTQASTDITIVNNVILQGEGSGQQGIFLRDELKNMAYQRVTIENNFVYVNSEFNGISVIGGSNIRIADNTVLSNENDDKNLFIKVDSVTNGIVTNNVSDFFVNTNNSNVELTNNVNLSLGGSHSSLLPTLNFGSTLNIGSLLLPGVGYQAPDGGSAPTAPPPISQPDTSNGAAILGAVSDTIGKALALQIGLANQVGQTAQAETRVAIGVEDDYGSASFDTGFVESGSSSVVAGALDNWMYQALAA